MYKFLLLSVYVTTAARAAPTPFDGIIRDAGDGSAAAFLSPPSGGNHASFIELMDDGMLAIAWFTGGEGTPNCSIAVSTLTQGASAWTPGRIASTRTNYSNQNPVLFWEAATQTLHLYHSSQATGGGGGEPTAQIWHTASRDRGTNWDTPAPFYTAAGAFDRNRIVSLRTGGLLFPCYMRCVCA